jgi:hypothetical protein
VALLLLGRAVTAERDHREAAAGVVGGGGRAGVALEPQLQRHPVGTGPPVVAEAEDGVDLALHLRQQARLHRARRLG